MTETKAIVRIHWPDKPREEVIEGIKSAAVDLLKKREEKKRK